MLYVYNLSRPREFEERRLGTDHIGPIAFSPAGRLLAVVCRAPDRQEYGPDHVKVVDSTSLNVVSTLREHTGEIHALAFSPDGKALVTCGSTLLTSRGWNRGELKLWDIETGRVKWSVDRPDDTFGSVAYSHSGKTFVTGGGHRMDLSEAGEITIWNATTFEQERTHRWVGGIVQSVAVLPGDNICAAGSADGYVTIWDANTLKEIYAYDTNSSNHRKTPVQALDVSPDGSILAVALGYWVRGGGWGELRLWDIRTRTTRAAPIRNYPRPVTSAVFSTDGRSLAAGCGDGTVRTWDMTAVARLR
jgi:WD40 repeat protein